MRRLNKRTLILMFTTGLVLGALYIWRGRFPFFWHVPSQSKAEVALETIAAVAAVVWTGGLISVQVRGNKATVSLRAALDFLQFGYIAPLFALFVNQFQLRVMACVFFMLYLDGLYETYLGLKASSDSIAQYESNQTLQILGRTQIAQWNRSIEALTIYAFWSAVGLAQYVIVGVYATQIAVAWTCAFSTFVGMQIMLRFLYGKQTVQPDDD